VATGAEAAAHYSRPDLDTGLRRLIGSVHRVAGQAIPRLREHSERVTLLDDRGTTTTVVEEIPG
jgi:hypothetical protein